MSYTISIIKDKFSTTEKEVYRNTLQSEKNTKLLIELIKRFDGLEQQLWFNNVQE